MSESIRDGVKREVALACAVRVGVDLAKRVVQVHAVDRAGKVLAARSLPREPRIFVINSGSDSSASPKTIRSAKSA